MGVKLEITKELVVHILKTSGDDPNKIADGIKKYQEIKRKMLANRTKEQNHLKEYEEKQKALKSERIELRKQCDHPTFSFHSGYEDSYNECDVCGYEW